MHVGARFALYTLLLMSSTAAFAQQMPQAETISVPRATTPDVFALRFYAKEGENERYKLELQRLQRMYPGFTPPENLLQDTAALEQGLWDLYGEGDVDALLARIEEIKRSDETWQPSEALSNELARISARTTLMNAYRDFDTNRVKEIANENPLLINPDDPEVVWAVAETFANEKDYKSAFEAYTFAVQSAQNSEVRAGALQKAAQNLTTEDAGALYQIALVQFQEENADRSLDIGFARGLTIRANQYGTGFPAEYIDTINLYMQQSMENNMLSDIEVLSWTLYNQRQYLPALALFQRSLEIRPDPKTVEGILLSLKELDRVEEAQPIATQWRTASADIAALYLNLWAPVLLTETPQSLSPEFLQTFALTTNDVSSGEGAEALGWYAYNVKQYKAADAWFQKAIEWDLTETAVLGRLYTAIAVKDEPLFDQIKAAYSITYPKVAAETFIQTGTAQTTTTTTTTSGTRQVATTQATRTIPRERSVSRVESNSNAIQAAFQAKNYTRCVELSDQQIARGRVGPDDYQTRGWCLMNLDRPAEAQEAFARAISTDGITETNRKASAYGASLAALGTGRTDTAYDIAKNNAMEGTQRATVNKEILTQRAIAAFRSNDYRSTLFALDELRKIAPEPRNLAHLRGWSLYYLGDAHGAVSVFEAIDSVYSTSDSRRALATAREKAGGRFFR